MRRIVTEKGFAMRLQIFIGFVLAGPLCLLLSAQEGNDEALRPQFESQFDELDSNHDGQLDETELRRFPTPSLNMLHLNGLPNVVPVPRELFVAASVALASSLQAAEESNHPKEEEANAGRDGKTIDSRNGKPAIPGSPAARTVTRKGHYVPDLPSEYSSFDKNGDGQIALYEWDRKKYSEFLKLDKNSDGFLTPAELLPAAALKAIYAKATNRPAQQGSAGASSAGDSNSGSGEHDGIEREARKTFGDMDESKDGSIDETEWGRSRRIRPWFESNGVKVSLPLNADNFVALYRRVRESSGR